jgi:hypothetical protein
MAATAGRLARLYLQSGAATPFTSGGMTNSGDNLVFGITASSAMSWDYDSAVTVSVGGVVQTTGYTLQKPIGQVTFGTATTGTVTVNTSYRTISQIAEAKEYTLDLTNALKEDTAFGDTAKTRVWLGQDAAASFGDWHTNGYLLDFAQSTSPYVVAFYISATTSERYVGYFFAEKNSVKAGARELIEGSASLVACGASQQSQAIYYKAS